MHIGGRLQATVVLSCPGLELSRFGEWAQGRGPRGPTVGLEAELEAVRAAVALAPVHRWAMEGTRRFDAFLRRQSRAGIGSDVAETRRVLRAKLPEIVRTSFPPVEPPTVSDGISSLPLFFDEKFGIVAVASHPGGWEFLALSEGGESPRSLNVLPVPDRPPRLDEPGDRALRAYLEYLLRRDSLYWSAAARIDPQDPESLLDEAEADLRSFCGLVLARAALRSSLRGEEQRPLGAEAIFSGIRATDAEFLDRPTLGTVL